MVDIAEVLRNPIILSRDQVIILYRQLEGDVLSLEKLTNIIKGLTPEKRGNVKNAAYHLLEPTDLCKDITGTRIPTNMQGSRVDVACAILLGYVTRTEDGYHVIPETPSGSSQI